MVRLLLLLALANLVIGTGAFVISSILEPIAADLGVSVPLVGQAMTVYALSTALLAPLALLSTGGWPRKRALQTALGLFALGNIVCVLAADLAAFLAGRVAMGLGAMLTPLAAGIAVASVDGARRGRALSIVFLGISLSYVVGLPLGAWLGFRFGWRVPIGLIAALSIAMIVVFELVLTDDVHAPRPSFAGAARAVAHAPVAWTLALTLLYFTAIFVVFSYIGPVLRALRPMGSAELGFTLMLFGLSGVAGTLIGGFANDRFGSTRTLTVQLTVLGAMMFIVPLTVGYPVATIAAFLVWGAAAFGMMAPQQSRLATAAPRQAPLLLSLNASMVYVGTALGAALGGGFSEVLGFARLPWVGIPLTALGLATVLIDRAQHQRQLSVQQSTPDLYRRRAEARRSAAGSD
ncbi:MAG: MFS transporter [Candidatus Binatia bacterium]